MKRDAYTNFQLYAIRAVTGDMKELLGAVQERDLEQLLTVAAELEDDLTRTVLLLKHIHAYTIGPEAIEAFIERLTGLLAIIEKHGWRHRPVSKETSELHKNARSTRSLGR